MSYLVLRNATLIDGRAPEARSGMTIAVQDCKIAAVEPDGYAQYPADAVVYDLGGRCLMPGFIDAHLHIAYTGAPDLPTLTMKVVPSYFAIRAALHAGQLLDAGVTAVRDGGSTAYADLAVKRAVDEGLVPGPRVRAAGYGLKMTGGHGDSFLSPNYTVVQPGLADTPDEARKVARTNLKMGADHLKILSASGGVMTVGTEPGAAQLTVEEMKAYIDEAHKAGKRAMAHLHGTQAIKNALQAGVDSVEHGSMLDDEAIETMIKQGTYLVPTFLAGLRLIQRGGPGLAPGIVDKAKALQDVHHASFRKALAAGIKIAMGTDIGTPYNYHGENLCELPLMVEAGMTPMQAIQAATRVGAELLDIGQQVGTVECGKLADLVVVDGNPLHEIALFNDKARVVQVIKDGKVFRSGLPASAAQVA